jgi:hypothetical protein
VVRGAAGGNGAAGGGATAGGSAADAADAADVAAAAQHIHESAAPHSAVPTEYLISMAAFPFEFSFV